MRHTSGSDLTEVGMKTLLLAEELLHLLAGLSDRLRLRLSDGDGGRRPAGNAEPSDGSLVIGRLEAELTALRRRLDRLEEGWRSSKAQGKNEMQEDVVSMHTRDTKVERPPGQGLVQGGVERATDRLPARLSRDTSYHLALAAARRLHQEGRAVTLASVARAAGLKYSQVVYAFRRRENLLERLKESDRA